MTEKFGAQLRPCIGARVFTPVGPGVLACVGEDYVVVKLEADGLNVRFYDDTAALLYADPAPIQGEE